MNRRNAIVAAIGAAITAPAAADAKKKKGRIKPVKRPVTCPCAFAGMMFVEGESATLGKDHGSTASASVTCPTGMFPIAGNHMVSGDAGSALMLSSFHDMGHGTFTASFARDKQAQADADVKVSATCVQKCTLAVPRQGV